MFSNIPINLLCKTHLVGLGEWVLCLFVLCNLVRREYVFLAMKVTACVYQSVAYIKNTLPLYDLYIHTAIYIYIYVFFVITLKDIGCDGCLFMCDVVSGASSVSVTHACYKKN